MFTPLTSADGGELRAGRGTARTRKARKEQSEHDGRGGGENAARQRGTGREARPFFDPRRGQLGANFSGGTGLTRPPGILAGAHIAAALDRRFRRENQERHIGTVSQLLSLLPLRRRDAVKPRTINIERTPPRRPLGGPRQSTVIENHVENKKGGRRVPRTVLAYREKARTQLISFLFFFF